MFISKHVPVGLECEIPRVTPNAPALGDRRRYTRFSVGLSNWTRSMHAKDLSTAQYPTAASAELACCPKRPGFGGSIACRDPPVQPKTSLLRGISCPKRPGFGGSTAKNVPASGDLGWERRQSSSPLWNRERARASVATSPAMLYIQITIEADICSRPTTYQIRSSR